MLTNLPPKTAPKRAGLATLSRRWRGDASGGVTVIFALAATVMFGFIALAVDYARVLAMRGRVVASIDNASLMVAKKAAELAASNPNMNHDSIIAQAKQTAQDVVLANLSKTIGAPLNNAAVNVAFTDGAWVATIDYQTALPTMFGDAIGMGSIGINERAVARLKTRLPVLDIAMCVDSTGSMTPTLDAVKTNALRFSEDLNAALNARGIPAFPVMRVRIIYFKDFGDATPGVFDPDPLRASPFHALPGEASTFSSFVTPQVAYGGMDTPESGLECLNEAIRSDWMRVGQQPAGLSQPVTDVYPLIAIWTDAPSHPLPFPNSLANPAYPSTMPQTPAGLLAAWNDPNLIDQTHKQILFFGNPDVTSADQGSYPSGWQDVKAWPRFAVGGSLTDANVSMINFLADGVSRMAGGLRLSQ